MARVKIEFPVQKPLFTTVIPVRIGDINYGGHVGNDAVLSIIHEARMQLMASGGGSELNIKGNGLIMADVMIAYRGEAFYGDHLTVDIFVDELKKVSFDLLYRITCIKGDVIQQIAHCKTGMVCFNYETRQLAEVTPELASFLGH